MTFIGSKYSSSMDVAEVAKRVRADIKAAQKVGALPKSLDVSVRISRYSMGRSLTITVKSAPVQIHESDFIAHEVRTAGRVHYEGHRYTVQAKAILEKLEAIGAEYQRSYGESSEGAPQYSFSLSAKFDWEMEREDRAILTEYHAALQSSRPTLRLVSSTVH